jgi:hypothetical protein
MDQSNHDFSILKRHLRFATAPATNASAAMAIAYAFTYDHAEVLGVGLQYSRSRGFRRAIAFL